jgi:regulator of protease activity HflC (stomatin/prohibitin superfamily)
MFLSFVSFLVLACVAAWFVLAKMNIAYKGSFKTKIAIPIIVIFTILLFRPFEIVRAGNVGVILTLGKVTNATNPGLVWILPLFQSVVSVTTQPIQVDQKIDVGPSGAITKDNQTVGASMTFFYKYKPDQIKSVYQDYGLDRLTAIVATSGTECFKNEIGGHAIFDIPINQAKIQSAVLANIRSKLTSYPLEITELKIVNYDWSEEFDKQIQETMHRAQQVKQKEQELLITEQEAQKKVKTAEADKEALIKTAEGEKAAALLRADAKAAEGAGIKQYNQSVQANMELELKIRTLEIERIKAEKWDGAYVPTNNYGPIPFSTGALQPK